MRLLWSTIARALIVISGAGLLLFVLFNTLPVLDQVSYAQAYVKGNVSQGYITEAQGKQLLQQEEATLLPYIVQIIGILGITISLLTIVVLIERLMNEKQTEIS